MITENTTATIKIIAIKNDVTNRWKGILSDKIANDTLTAAALARPTRNFAKQTNKILTMMMPITKRQVTATGAARTRLTFEAVARERARALRPLSVSG